MYEPVDGRGAEGCIAAARRALAEAAPVVISTHRYNYTRDAASHRASLAGLARILDWLEQNARPLRFLSSPELGDAIRALTEPGAHTDAPAVPALAPLTGLPRLAAWHARLVHRHPKLRWLLLLSTLALPLAPCLALGRRALARRRARRAAGLPGTRPGPAVPDRDMTPLT
jgi:hypothetical protein